MHYAGVIQQNGYKYNLKNNQYILSKLTKERATTNQLVSKQQDCPIRTRKSFVY